MIRRMHAFGCAVEVDAAEPELFEHLACALPPFLDHAAEAVSTVVYRVVRRPGSFWVLIRGRRTLGVSGDLLEIARQLAADLAVTLSRIAPGRTFVHAGVVAVRGAVIVLPGRSGAGKSTLVRALLEAGAAYGSDEFAVIDNDGRIRPWDRWIGIRHEGRRDERVNPRAGGASVMENDLPVAAIVFTAFAPGADVQLRPVPPGEAALRLIEHCLAARTRPARTLRALRSLTRTARAFESPRAEAGVFAARLLAAIDLDVAAP